ncbi:sialidase family protein [Coraliomargarita sp. W4R72]
MSAEEARAHELDVIQQIADLSLLPPRINTNPLPEYDYDQLDYGMVIGSARTPKGRIWSCWVAGEDGPEAFMVAACSDDDGETWSKPKLVIDSQASHLPIPRSVIVGNFWTAPDGRLWWFFDQTMNHADGRHGVWVSICDDPDAEQTVWSEPKRIWHGAVLNKPTVLSNGEWLLPVEFPNFKGVGPMAYANQELEPLRGANVFVSQDEGETWERRGNVRFPKPSWPEHMFVELKDGRIWMVARTANGAMQSFSSDGGRSWSEASFPHFKQPAARFYISRLASGRILLVKHGDRIDAHNGRVQLSAWISEDEGETWQGGLVLDERSGVSYPDGFQAPDGMIYVTYDRNRSVDGEILMARFSEEDVLAGKLVETNSKLKMLVSRPMKNYQAEFVATPQAELVTSEGEIHEAQVGARVFSNRPYTFNELPSQLIGKRFVFSDLEKTEVTCSQAGVVYVICATEENNPNDNPVKELKAQGFVRTNVPEFVYTRYNGLARKAETCAVYQMVMKQGDTVSFGRWGILVF